jgi:hypothetical protein
VTSVPARLAAFAAALAAVFAAAFGVGAAARPLVAQAPPPAEEAAAAHDGVAQEGGHAPAGAAAPVGLAATQDGYTLELAGPALEAGREQEVRFTIRGPDGEPLRDYAEEHDRELHLILVRRDLSGFQHVHPTRDAQGTWSIPLTLPEAGTYRAFADFTAAGGPSLTLGADLHASGPFSPRPLPAPARTAEVDGYTVELDGELVAGAASDLTLTVRRDGRPVDDLDAYLGAYGHLVALRAGDLAYLHVHPHGEPGDGVTAPGPAIAFTAEVPSAGTYGLYLDFQHEGVVRTAAFTATAVAP